MRIKKLFAVVLTCIMALTTTALTVSAEEVATVSPSPVADQFSGIGSYMAFLQCQTTTWVYRNNLEDAGAGYGSDIFKTVYNNETSAATSTVIKDTVVDGDGEYSVALQSISLEGSTDWNMIGISTNLPLDAGFEITAATLKYGTNEITSTFVQQKDNKAHIHLMLINQYAPEMKDTINTIVPADGTDVTITFTVTGFGYAKTIQEEVVVDTTEAAITPVANETVTTAEDTTEAAEKTAEDKNNSTPSTGVVIGIIAGVIIVVGILVVAIRFKKKKNA